VRDLDAIEPQKAELDVLIANAPPTHGMIEVNGHTSLRVQIITVSELLAGKRPNLRATINPYMGAGQCEKPPSSSNPFEA